MTGQRGGGDATIFALSSAPGPAGIAVVRASGPDAGDALAATIDGAVPPPRRAAYRAIIDPATGDLLDRGLVLWFPAPASATGEVIAEWHVHGGRAVVGGLLEALGALPGMRPAKAGEFSRRAFLNTKMDLTAIEGLADLVVAETEAQRRQAVRQMDGVLGTLYEEWRHTLIAALAHVEAAFDFSDQELPEGLISSAVATARSVAEAIRAHLDDSHRGERLRDGVLVAVVGPPNAGKSSLVNALARRDVAIVSASPGTTRDVIEVHLDLGGVPVTVADTAGLRDTGDAVEQEGVRRARRRAADADVVFAVFDAVDFDEAAIVEVSDIPAEALVILNKMDLVEQPAPGRVAGRRVLAVSCLTGLGLDQLVTVVAERASACVGEGLGPTRARHRAALATCVDALARLDHVADAELVAEDLRIATQALGRLTGRVDVEDILDVIFAEFCIGK